LEGGEKETEADDFTNSTVADPIPSSTLCILFNDRISENCIELPDQFVEESLRIFDGLSPEPASPFLETAALG
jgi:hypothetical protein